MIGPDSYQTIINWIIRNSCFNFIVEVYLTKFSNLKYKQRIVVYKHSWMLFPILIIDVKLGRRKL